MRFFISYRRQDSKYQARMIYDAFAREVGQDNVFMDVDSIPPGANFRKTLKEWVDRCDALLALIGPEWIAVADPATRAPTLDNPNDLVRIEIAEALARGIPVVPVLLDGADVPQVEQLPDDLKELCDRQAEFVEFRTFNADVERLIARLRAAPKAVPNDVAEFRKSFWAAYLERFPDDRQLGVEVTGASSNWLPADVGKSVVVSLWIGKTRIGVFVRGPRGSDGSDLARRLDPVRKQLEQKLGAKYGRTTGANFFDSTVRLNMNDKTNWPEAIQWMHRTVTNYLSRLGEALRDAT